MSDILNLILINWKVILIVSVTLITFLLQVIFKKRPVIKDDSAVFNICKAIESAEKLFGNGNGEKKLQYVLDLLHDDKGVYKNLIEWILSLPSKK